MPDTDIQSQSSPDSSSSLIQSELQLALVTREGTPQPAFTLTKTGIFIREDLQENEWKEGLKLFYWAQHSLKLGFSQYISYGRAKKFNVNEALAQLEFDLPTVKVAMDLATVPLEMQFENLTAEHYLVLARADDQPKPKKLKWAKIASEQNLSPSQLKASMAAGEVVSTSTTRQQTHGIINIHGIRQEFEIWLRRVGGVEGILKMDEEHRNEIIGEMNLMVEVHNQIKSGKPPKKAAKKAAKKTAKKKKEKK